MSGPSWCQNLLIASHQLQTSLPRTLIGWTLSNSRRTSNWHWFRQFYHECFTFSSSVKLPQGALSCTFCQCLSVPVSFIIWHHHFCFDFVGVMSGEYFCEMGQKTRESLHGETYTRETNGCEEKDYRLHFLKADGSCSHTFNATEELSHSYVKLHEPFKDWAMVSLSPNGTVREWPLWCLGYTWKLI